MNTAELIAPEATAPAQILEIVESSGIASESAVVLKSQLAPFFVQAQEWQSKLATITEAKDARESRLLLRKVRVDAEHKKDSLKKTALAYTNAVDACFRLIKATVEPMEERLLEIEKAAERAEALRKTKVRDERAAQLVAVGFDPSFTALADIPEEAFQALLKQQTAAHGLRVAAEKKAAEEARIAAEKAEQDRIAKEQAEAAERERIRQENERLKREAAQREEAARIERERRANLHSERCKVVAPLMDTAEYRSIPNGLYGGLDEEEFSAIVENLKNAKAQRDAAAKERARIEAEAKAREEVAAKEREEIERKAREERQAREKAEAELKAANEAKAAKEKADREAAERAAAAPDREKLLALAETIRGLPIPAMSTAKGKAKANDIAGTIADLARLVERHAKEL